MTWTDILTIDIGDTQVDIEGTFEGEVDHDPGDWTTPAYWSADGAWTAWRSLDDTAHVDADAFITAVEDALDAYVQAPECWPWVTAERERDWDDVRDQEDDRDL